MSSTENAIVALDGYVLSEGVYNVGLENVVYATDGSAVLLEGDEYYIQTADGAFVLNSNDEGGNIYVNENDGSSEENGVRLVAESELEENEKIQMGSELVETVFGEEMEVLNDESDLVEYAVLRDGQLHIRLAENDTVEILDTSDTDKVSELFFENAKDRAEENDYDEDPLEDAPEGESEPNFLNRKFTIGKKPDGKYLIGRIVDIQTNEADSERDRRKCGEEIGEDQMEFLTDTLIRITDIYGVTKRVFGRLLRIKWAKVVGGSSEGRVVESESCFEGFFVTSERNGMKFHDFNVLPANSTSSRTPATRLAITTTTVDASSRKRQTRIEISDGPGPAPPPFLDVTVSHPGRRTADPRKPTTSTTTTSSAADADPLRPPSRGDSAPSATVGVTAGATGAKSYACETCGRAFARHSNLVRHQQVHGAAGFGCAAHRCAVCGCSYRFGSSLTRHVVQKHVVGG